MKQNTIEKLCCPFDKHDLSLEIFVKDLEGNILKGILHCAGCNRFYPIVHGIPIMTPDEYREFQLEKKLIENKDDNK